MDTYAKHIINIVGHDHVNKISTEELLILVIANASY